MIQSARQLRWSACVNVRDLGGLSGVTGTIRDGVLVRASSLGALDADGAAAMRAHGVRSVVDLRWPSEVAALPSPFAPGVAYRNVPVDAAMKMDLPGHAARGTLPELLETMLLPQSGLRDAIAAIVSSKPAVVVHCQAGRDRTGFVVALVLAAVGVRDDDIVGDHCASDEALAEEYARFRRERPELAADLDGRIARRAEVIRALLAELRGGYGDAAGYLQALGLPPGTADGLRTLLLA